MSGATMDRVFLRSVSKMYKVYAQPRRRLLEWVTAGRYRAHRPVWALRDVSLTVGDGESLGIIGMNGAGKSTLLKILTGTTPPTEGEAHLTGSAAALLELGLGMHPELSGRENAVLIGQLMGLEPAAIAASLADVEAFAELRGYLEQPLRTYSTGMQVRLAFSAATAVRPDILVVDEALAVGDAYFQHKSIGRIREFQRQGTTLLFVTHDPRALKAVCRRSILLDGGRLVRDGPTEAVFDYYNASIARRSADFDVAQGRTAAGAWETRSRGGGAAIVSVELSGSDGRPRRAFRCGETARLAYRVRVHQAMETPTAGFIIRDRLGNDVFGTNTDLLDVPARPLAAGASLTIAFDVALHLGPGEYSVAAALHRGFTHLVESFDWWDHALAFRVVPAGEPASVGVAALPVHATVVEDAEGASALPRPPRR